MDFQNLKGLFEIRKKDFQEFGNSYDELIRRSVQSLIAEPQGEWGDSKRIREYCLVLQQVLLHRAINLFSGSLTALSENNAYSMVLSVRGHFETTAALGYLNNRLNSLAAGNLEARVVDHDISVLLLGTRDEGILKLKEAMQNDMEAKHVLDMLEYADKYVSKHVLGGAAKEHISLKDYYKHLCEFSHPNFHSNAAAFELREKEKKFYFNYNKSLEDKYFNLIEYLLISNPIFIELFDGTEGLLQAAGI